MYDATAINRIAIAAKPHKFSIRKYNTPQLTIRAITAATLLLREIALCVFQSISILPKRGCSYSQRCKRSEPFAENQAANSKKGTVGITGRNTPIIASTKKVYANINDTNLVILHQLSYNQTSAFAKPLRREKSDLFTIQSQPLSPATPSPAESHYPFSSLPETLLPYIF